MGLVLREASYPILGGLALSTIAALGTTPRDSKPPYETQAADPIAISASIALLLGAALVAGSDGRSDWIERAEEHQYESYNLLFRPSSGH